MWGGSMHPDFYFPDDREDVEEVIDDYEGPDVYEPEVDDYDIQRAEDAYEAKLDSRWE